MNHTEMFFSSITDLFHKEIPDEIYDRARYSLMDYVGVTLAGASSQKDRLKKFLDEENPERGSSTAIGMCRNMNLKDAVFFNGLNGHALDYDDGTNTGIIHLGSPIFSVLLPLAEKYQIDFDRFLKSVIIGYEASFTMAVSIQPRHKEMGYHATGTCGIIGIAFSAAYLLGLTEEETRNVFSAACMSATGMLRVLDDGSELKPYNVAKTALLGLCAVQMARMGFAGPPDPLGGSRGYLKMMTGLEKVELKQPLLLGTYAIEKTYTKPYAACRYCHPAIEAAIMIASKHLLREDDVEEIVVRTYYWAVNKHDHVIIPSAASAKMSIPYGVAVGLLFGKAGLAEYDNSHVTDLKILKLVSKVKVEVDEQFTEQFPEKTSALVTIKTKGKEEYQQRVDFPKGEPENPLSQEEFLNRFTELVKYADLTEKQAGEIRDAIMNEKNSMNHVFELLSMTGFRR